MVGLMKRCQADQILWLHVMLIPTPFSTVTPRGEGLGMRGSNFRGIVVEKLRLEIPHPQPLSPSTGRGGLELTYWTNAGTEMLDE